MRQLGSQVNKASARNFWPCSMGFCANRKPCHAAHAPEYAKPTVRGRILRLPTVNAMLSGRQQRDSRCEEPFSERKMYDQALGGQDMLLIPDAAQISAEYGIDPMHKSPIKARLRVVKVPILKSWDTVTDEVTRNPACIDKALHHALRPGRVRKEGFRRGTDDCPRHVGKVSKCLGTWCGLWVSLRDCRRPIFFGLRLITVAKVGVIRACGRSRRGRG